MWVGGLTVVEGDDVEDVEQLSLVLVDPLHLHVKQGVRVDLHSMSLLQVGRKPRLVLLCTHTHTHTLNMKQTPMSLVADHLHSEESLLEGVRGGHGQQLLQ